MYLESIFIGGDIRAQLPEEAKKFDNIDKTFKKVWMPSKHKCNYVIFTTTCRSCLTLPRTPGCWRRVIVLTGCRIWRCSAPGWNDARKV